MWILCEVGRHCRQSLDVVSMGSASCHGTYKCTKCHGMNGHLGESLT